MRTVRFALCIVVLCIIGCSSPKTENTQDLLAITGSWKGGHVSPPGRTVSQWNFFSSRPDSSLALSMIYEIGPRSRVWTFDEDVTVREGKVLWPYHEGVLSLNRDTMTMVNDYRGEKSVWRFVRDSSVDSFMVALYAYGGESFIYRIPENLNDGWTCADLSECGLNTGKIGELVEEIRNGDHDDIHSVLIVKNGKLVLEEYFAAGGSKHGSFITGHFRGRVHHLASTTKSVTSALVGIAIDLGFMKDVEEPIYHYLPAYSSLFDDNKKRIRIRDMLTMTPGFEWSQFGVSEARNDGMQMWHADDVIRFVLQKQLVAEPGRQFNYSNGVPTVTGAIIKNATGMAVADFAEQYLFCPLGISEYLWTSYPDGSIETDGGLALRPRDLAKIGQLYLDGGVWNGKRIVSERWVKESTQERLRFGRSGQWGYGYHWMQTETRIGDRVVRSYFVPGDGNQILTVFPELEMIIVFTAGNYGRDPKSDYYSIFEEFILPAAGLEG